MVYPANTKIVSQNGGLTSQFGGVETPSHTGISQTHDTVVNPILSQPYQKNYSTPTISVAQLLSMLVHNLRSISEFG